MRSVRFAAYLLVFLPSLALAADPFYLKDGDRVVFYGDSITDQRLYTTYVETYVLTRFPNMHVDFIHSGWGGDRVTGGGGGPIDIRLKRDVIAYKPTVMTIMLGMNDASYRRYDQGIFDTYAKGMRKIVERVKDEVPNIRITLIQPSPFDDVTRPPVFEGGYNAVLTRYGQYLKELAEESHVDLADLNTSVVEATKKAYELDPEKAKELNKDRVHPGPGGQLLMAAALLKAWNAPSVVTEVHLKAGKPAPSDAAPTASLVNAVNTGVPKISTDKDGTISWSQDDGALPFPINLADPIVALAVKSSEVVPQLDREILKVEGLSDGDYTLKIDDKEVGHFSNEQFADGVNLAVLETPMRVQAERVHNLTLRHNNLHYVRWRNLQVPYQDLDQAKMAKAIEAIDALEADIIKEQRKVAEPKPHTYELSKKK